MSTAALASSSLADARAEFPVCRRFAYFMSAGMGPLPSRVHDELAAHLGYLRDEGGLGFHQHRAAVESVRRRLAAFVGVNADDLAFVPSVSFGVNAVALSLAQAGHRGTVVTLEDEFPSTVMGWERAGFTVERVPCPNAGYRVEDIDGWLRRAPARSIVAFTASWVGFATGLRLDLEALGRVLAARDVPFVVNATQGVGVLPLHLRRAQASAAVFSCHKGLLAPEGNAALYVQPAFFQRLRPAMAGWRSVVDPMAMSSADAALRDDARVFELGTPNTLAVLSLGASLSLLDAVGPAQIEQHVRGLVEGLRASLPTGFHARRGPGEAGESGIVLLDSRADAQTVVDRLRGEGVLTTRRAGGVRVSTHLFNDANDVDRLLAALERSAASKE